MICESLALQTTYLIDTNILYIYENVNLRHIEHKIPLYKTENCLHAIDTYIRLKSQRSYCLFSEILPLMQDGINFLTDAHYVTLHRSTGRLTLMAVCDY